MASTTSENVVPCPDPSAHQMHSDPRLQDAASRAALLVTQSPISDSTRNLDNDRLASSGAATSLKYARPENLPSFPIVGIDKVSSAGAAASLAHANRKPFEHWKPDPSSAAGKAALLASDHRAAPAWQPEASAAGSKAALLAHRDSPKTTSWTPNAGQGGSSAATIAMRGSTTPSQANQGSTEDGHRWALQAATGSVGRRRADSTPVPGDLYPDASNAKPNALHAATTAHKPTDSNRWGSDAMESARIRNIGTHLPREMYTEHPPVQIEVEEQRHQAALRASAISFAKQMYAAQEKHLQSTSHGDGHTAAALQAHKRAGSSAKGDDLKQQAMQYIGLQETARKLASERLAKMNPDESTRFRNYYGYENAPRSRLSLRGRNRQRSSSEGARADSDDEEQARRIRNQTSRLNTGLAVVDAKKRTADRVALMAAAEKRVQARMHDMDEKVFMETGKVSPAMMEEWETKARAKAVAASEDRMKTYGKVHVGHGKFMDQSEVDAIARQRIQPTLDQINDTAEKQRAKDEEQRLDEEVRRRESHKEKERNHQEKLDARRLKEEIKAAEKAKKADEKAASRLQKEAEKSRRKEEKTTAKDEKRRSQRLSADVEESQPVAVVAVQSSGLSSVKVEDRDEFTPHDDPAVRPNLEQRTSIMPGLERHISTIPSSSSSASSFHDADEGRAVTDAANVTAFADNYSKQTVTEPRPEQPTSPTKKEGGIRGFLGKLKTKKKSTPGSLKPLGSQDAKDNESTEQTESSFIGGATLTGATASSPRQTHAVATSPPGKQESSEISSTSEVGPSRGRSQTQQSDPRDLVEEAKDHFDEARLSTPKFAKEERTSPVRQTVFHEEL